MTLYKRCSCGTNYDYRQLPQDTKECEGLTYFECIYCQSTNTVNTDLLKDILSGNDTLVNTCINAICLAKSWVDHAQSDHVKTMFSRIQMTAIDDLFQNYTDIKSRLSKS